MLSFNIKYLLGTYLYLSKQLCANLIDNRRNGSLSESIIGSKVRTKQKNTIHIVKTARKLNDIEHSGRS